MKKTEYKLMPAVICAKGDDCRLYIMLPEFKVLRPHTINLKATSYSIDKTQRIVNYYACIYVIDEQIAWDHPSAPSRQGRILASFIDVNPIKYYHNYLY